MAKWNVPILLPADPTAALEAATKQYVDNGLATKAPLNNAALTGVPTAPTPAASDNSTQIATTAYVNSKFASDLTLGGDLLPDADNVRSLGSPTMMWKDVYIGPGSLYLNGQKILEDTESGTIRMTADPNQNIAIQTQGTGDIELNPLGTGLIQLKSNIMIDGAAMIRSSDGLSILFDDSIEFLPGAGIVGGLNIDGQAAWHAGNFNPALKLDATATATAATRLATARNFSLTGVITSTSVGFDGTGNVALSTSIADGALTIAKTGGLQAALDSKSATGHTHVIGDVTGLQAALDAAGTAMITHTATHRRMEVLDAQYQTNTSSVTGAFKITLPVSWTNTMMGLRIRGYNYSSRASWEILVGGYNFSTTPAWTNCNAYVVAGDPKFNKVRFAHDGTKCVIVIGDITDVHDYPMIEVVEAHMGYNGADDLPNSGWTIAPITSETGLTFTGGIASLYANTPTGLLNAVKTVDGAASGLDADLLDGLQGSSYLRADTASATIGVGVTNADVILTMANPGIGYASGFLFDRTSDDAGVSVTEYSSDQTLYEMWMSDNPDSAVDIFSWRFTDWQGINGTYQPLQIAGMENRFIGVNTRFHSPIQQSTAGFFTTGDPTKTNNTRYINYVGDLSKLKLSGTGTATITSLNVTGYTGTNGKVFWIRLLSPTTFEWGYNSHTTSPVPVETGLTVSTGTVSLSNGVTVSFSSTSTGVAGDVFQCRLYRKPTTTLSDTTVTGTLSASGATTLSGGLTVAGSGATSLTGNTTVGGTLGVAGVAQFDGGIVINAYSGGLRFNAFNANVFYAHGLNGPGDNVFTLTRQGTSNYDFNVYGKLQVGGSDVWHVGNFNPALKLDASTYTATDIRTKLLTVDGSGSGLDADLLDGLDSTYFLPKKNNVAIFSDPESFTTVAQTNYKRLGIIYENNGQLRAFGTLGGHTPTEGRATIDLNFSLRAGLRVSGSIIGKVGSGAWIEVRARVDDGDPANTPFSSEYDVYLCRSNYYQANVQAFATGSTQLDSVAAWTTTVPTGTMVWSLATHDPGHNAVRFIGDTPGSAVDLYAGTNKVWHQGNDGTGSGLDADLIDGLDSAVLLRSDIANPSDYRMSQVNGRGIRFWDNNAYKIHMSPTSDATYGGTITGETVSDFNMYLRMGTGTGANRGFVFETDYATKLFAIHPDKVRSNVAIQAPTFQGALTGNVSGNASTATALATARSFSLTGVITAASVNFDGTGNVALATSIADAALSIAKTSGLQAALDAKVASSLLGVAGGVATLDGTGKVPASQLPSFVDDVVEYANLAAFPATGVAGVLYVALDTGRLYRWSGSVYNWINASVGAADTATKWLTARTITLSGKASGSVSIDGSADVTLNVTGLSGVKADVGLGNVDNTSDANKPVSTAQQTALNLKANLSGATFTGSVAGPNFQSENPNNTLANINLSWLSDAPRLRIGGSGTGAAGTFTIQGTSDFVRMSLDSAGNGAFAGSTLTVGGNTVYHAGNFNPATKLDATANAVSATKLVTARNINGVAFDGTANITLTFTKSDVGLGNVDNTSDANKPISTATATALADKVGITATGLGKVGANGNDSVTITPALWSALPSGYSRFMNGSIGTGGGAPTASYGYFHKFAQRDVSGGWAGLWIDYSGNHNLYIGVAADSTVNATWRKVWTDANDGSGSGLDSDLLDGQDGTYYRNADNLNAGTLPPARLPTGVLRNDLVLLDATAQPQGAFWTDGGNGQIKNTNNSTGSTNFPTEFGVAWTFRSQASANSSNYSRTFDLYHPNNQTELYLRTYDSAGVPLTWNKLWHEGNDGAGSNLDADKLDGQQGSWYLDLTNATGILPATKGGTGMGGFTVGNYLRAATTTTLEERTAAQVRKDIGATRFLMSETKPTPDSDNNPGDEWLKPSTGVTYTWVDDGDSTQWVNLKATKTTGAVVQTYMQPVQPGDTTDPFVWWETGLGEDGKDFTMWLNIPD